VAHREQHPRHPAHVHSDDSELVVADERQLARTRNREFEIAGSYQNPTPSTTSGNGPAAALAFSTASTGRCDSAAKPASSNERASGRREYASFWCKLPIISAGHTSPSASAT
jgi:hypothetical protein